MEKRYLEEISKFGLQVKTLREEKGLSQLDLELKSGLDRADISKIESGKNNVRFITIVKLAEALQVEMKDFFS